jgi:hypothetical protein
LGGEEMNENEKLYLCDTITILIDYDGFRTPEGLMSLIDEVKERLVNIRDNKVTSDTV